MSDTVQNTGLSGFLKDGLTVAVFIGLLLTLQAAAMKEQAQLYQTASSATVAAIPDVTDLMIAGNSQMPRDDFNLPGLYASRYTSESDISDLIDLHNIAPAAGD